MYASRAVADKTRNMQSDRLPTPTIRRPSQRPLRKPPVKVHDVSDLKVLTLGSSPPDGELLDEACRIAGIRIDHASVQLPAASDGLPALAQVDLVVSDDLSSGSARELLDEIGSTAPMLVLCNGSISARAAKLLRAGRADLAARDDAPAIAAALSRAALRRDGGLRDSVEAELRKHRAQLEQIVCERTRELEESHQRLRLSERMAAMGTLATGIGHDIGNLVLPLRIGLDSLERRRLPAGSEPDIIAIRKSVEYLQGLANGLRYLAMDPDDVGIGSGHNDLHDWWADIEPLLKNCLPREIALVREFAPVEELPEIAMPLHHLTHVVFNLVQNAGDAMRGRDSGSVRIKAESSTAARTGQSAVKLAVIDDGPGMSAKVRERCIEPFFTTKFRGVRTGLGLPLVHGLIRRAGGEVELESAPGRGTNWILTIPAQGGPSSQTLPQCANARVDLADSRMCAYVNSVLRSLGFEVHAEPGQSQTILCVTEPDRPLGRVAASLLAESEDMHIVLFGSGAISHPRLYQLGDSPSSATIRTALRDVRDSLRS